MLPGCADVIVFTRHEPEFSRETTPQHKCLRGEPEQRTWHHFTSKDGKFFTGIWEADPGCWRINYTENEFFQMLEGKSVLRDGNGRELQLSPGDSVVIPAGFRGEWDVIERTRKIYVIYTP